MPVLENPSQAREVDSPLDGVKVHGRLREQLELEVVYGTTVRYLHDLGYNLRVPRPWPERQNEEDRSASLEQFRTWQADPTVELCLPTSAALSAIPFRRWSARGSRLKVSRRPYPSQLHRLGVPGYRRMLHDDF